MVGEVVTEKMNLLFVNEENKTEERPTAVGRISDIPEFVMQLLYQYEKEGKLSWHNTTIPDDEIWVKIGGDHGRGSFKVALQIANLANPNSKLNTCLILIILQRPSGKSLSNFGPIQRSSQNVADNDMEGEKDLFVFVRRL